MRTTIDGAGRVVVPKRVREAAGMVAGCEVDVEWDGESVRLSVPVIQVGPGGLGPDDAGLPFDEVLATIDAQRR